MTQFFLASNRPPPLQLLPPFEAAARLGSFKKAADELHVTASAISQQVRALEQWLGTRLFARQPRGIELTPAGHQFQDIAAGLLGEYSRQFARFHARQARPVLRVSMIPFMAHELILPRLQEFQQRHPDIDLRIETSMGLVDFAVEPIDAALRFGTGPWAGLMARPLCSTTATLVGAPDLLRALPLREPADLGRHTLIHSRRDRDDWQEAAQRLGVADVKGKNALILDDYFSAMQAAAQGLGLAIAILPITRRWMLDGRLAQALPFQLPTDQSYQFICRREQAEDPALLALYEWVLSVMQEVATLQP